MTNWKVANDELYHHGILGMKWGVTNGPPYPLDESDHSASEEKAGWKKSLSAEAKAELRAKKKQDRAEKRARKKARKEEKAEKKWDKKKAKIINKGDIKSAKKKVDKLSNEEIQAVINRYRILNNLSDLNEQVINAGKNYVQQKANSNQNNQPKKEKVPFSKKIDKAADTLDKYKRGVENGVKAYNVTAKVVNSLTDKKLPVIELGDKKRDTHARIYDEDGNVTQETIRRANGDTDIFKYKSQGERIVDDMLKGVYLPPQTGDANRVRKDYEDEYLKRKK